MSCNNGGCRKVTTLSPMKRLVVTELPSVYGAMGSYENPEYGQRDLSEDYNIYYSTSMYDENLARQLFESSRNDHLTRVSIGNRRILKY